MSITADTVADTVNIYGRNGVETFNNGVDTIWIDLDLAFSGGVGISGLVITGQELKANVDGTTITINGSNQLAGLLNVVSVINDFDDVNAASASNNQMLAYDSATGQWIPQFIGLAGDTGPASGAQPVIEDITTGTAAAAAVAHTHNENTLDATEDDHRHEWPTLQMTSTPASSSVVVLRDHGSASGSFSAVSSIAKGQAAVAPAMSHTHSDGTLDIVFS